ncbi:MAG TPA: membrane protein insertion efficiency factor YidD [Spirochaetota bacterium]|nr:membrane protein insertion efficiency factor YidD [Spirochaetota bacterium]
MKHLAIFFVKLYQKIVSPWLPKSCRFYPSCSEYSVQAFMKYGFFKGFWLTVRRVGRCHPFHPGGYDPLK